MGLNLRKKLDPPFEDNLVLTNRLIEGLDAADDHLLESALGGLISTVAGLERRVVALEAAVGVDRIDDAASDGVEV